MLHKNSHHFGCYRNRPDNWICKCCNREIFGSKEYCLKCNLDKNGNKKFIHLHTSGDWNCPVCKFRVSILNKYCNKCNVNIHGELNVYSISKIVNINSDIPLVE